MCDANCVALSKRLRFRLAETKNLSLSNHVCDANCVASSEKVEVERFGNKEPQPLVILRAMQIVLPFLRRFRLREVETKSFKKAHHLHQREGRGQLHFHPDS